MLIESMREYVSTRGISRGPIHSASRFVRIVGDFAPAKITTDLLREFKRLAQLAGLSVWTIKGTLKDIRTLIRSTGTDVTIDRIRKPEPNPQPVPHSTIDLLWPHLAGWSRQWLALSYWTGLRLADSIRMQRDLTDGRLEWTANKTKHRHTWPVVPWLVQWLQPQTLPYTSTDDWSKVIVRAELDRVCTLAGVDRMQPSQIRDTGLRAWCRADFHAGKVLHGCGMGIIGHYVSVLDVLEPVAPRVRVPASMLGTHAAADSESTLLGNFRRLDPACQGIISMTAERLAAG